MTSSSLDSDSADTMEVMLRTEEAPMAPEALFVIVMSGAPRKR